MMNDSTDQGTPVLPYASSKPPRLWKAFAMGIATVPMAYMLTYLALRVCGVYYPFYNQGGWEMDGGTNIYIVDVAFLPATIIEMDIQNRLRWLPEPTGG